MAPAAGADRRQGGWGARSRSRRDEDGGREKGHGGEDSAFLTAQCGG
jgi:hypothetical protein